MKKFIRFLFFVLLFILLLLIYGRYVGTEGLITKEYQVKTDVIPDSFDGLKIVHFSDLHYKRVVLKDEVEKVVKEINLINPDIVIFTGDLIDKDFEVDEDDISTLKKLLGSINSAYGKYAIRGNHDYVKEEDIIKDIYNESDFTYLQNNYDIIYGNDGNIFIGGLDTYSYDKSDIDEVMKYFEENDDIPFKIILSHEPDYTDTILENYNPTLILSGHSHNGQINIPFVKTLFLPYGSKKYYDNYYHINNTDLYISSGIGESRINFRMFNKPSINFYRINKITD